jgi:hypothetical protein
MLVADLNALAFPLCLPRSTLLRLILPPLEQHPRRPRFHLRRLRLSRRFPRSGCDPPLKRPRRQLPRRVLVRRMLDARWDGVVDACEGEDGEEEGDLEGLGRGKRRYCVHREACFVHLLEHLLDLLVRLRRLRR